MIQEFNSKHQVAYKHLKGLILNHLISPGQKLIYRDLEEKIGMSKTPIINALIMLEKEGLVAAEQNRGFHVCEVNADEAKEIFDLRVKLEQIAIEYAIRKCNEKDLKLLWRKLNESMEYTPPIYDMKRLTLDTEFHLQIARMGQNRFFLDLIKQFYENIYFRVRVEFLSPCIEKFKREHYLLFDAIKRRSIREAKVIVKHHTQFAGAYLVKHLK